MKFAVMGLRHGHIQDLIGRVQERPDLELVGICEEDAETRNNFAEQNSAAPIFDSYEAMLEQAECDVIAIGDYYTKRGQIAITALERGKHVLSDKPLCTRLDELDAIAQLARTKGLSVGCMFNLRESAALRTLAGLVHDGELGTVHAVHFGGQHPLLEAKRPSWYFEAGKHGGTISDIAVHALDFLPILTGQEIVSIEAARNWNARLPQIPWFKEAAQLMLTLSGGCGVMGDVSYLLPDSFGYANPHYWRFVVWGEHGMAETHSTAKSIVFYKNGETTPRLVPVHEDKPTDYLDSFLADVNGTMTALTTDIVLHSTRVTLLAQQVADEGRSRVEVTSGVAAEVSAA